MAATTVAEKRYTNKLHLRLTEQTTTRYTKVTMADAHMGEASDIRQLDRDPIEGLTILGGFLRVSGIDTNATATGDWSLRITDGTTTKIVVSLLAAANSGAVSQKFGDASALENAIGFTLPAPAAGAHWRTELFADNVSATQAASGGVIEYQVTYTNQPD